VDDRLKRDLMGETEHHHLGTSRHVPHRRLAGFVGPAGIDI